MGQKESLQKEIDALLDKMKFWRNIAITIISAIIGIIFGISQHKIENNFITEILILSGGIIIVISILLMYMREEERIDLIKKLEKVD